MQALRRTLGFASHATARKPRVVVLGSGWGGNKVARYLDKSKFDVRVVSTSVEIKFRVPHAIDAIT
jgi:NADH dehydrogenase FAD-containing subunit